MSGPRGRRRVLVALVLLAASIAFGCSRAQIGAAGNGWVILLDASKLGEWQQVGNANWRVVDGLVQADGGEGYLVSPRSYADVEVRAEFWVDDEANSGLFVRCQEPRNITPFNSYEVNIFDKTPNPGFGTGSIVAVARVPPRFKAAGRWNTYEITAKGSRLTVRLNGVQTVEVSDARHVQGPIAIQRASGVVKFRKLEVRPL